MGNGYVRCESCGCMRPVGECRFVATGALSAWFCLEPAWCRAFLNHESGPLALQPTPGGGHDEANGRARR